jgi:hypothetical protein
MLFQNLYIEQSTAFYLTQEKIIESQQSFSEYGEQLSKSLVVDNKRGKAIPVTGHGDPQVCEMSRLPHCLDNRHTDGGEVASAIKINLGRIGIV